jgi:Uma2 family endonuclease
MMATTVAPPEVGTYRDEGYFLFEGAGWDFYERLDAWADERPGVKIFYLDGDVVVMGISRRHDWLAHRVDNFVWALANAAGVPCEDAGGTTFREQAKKAGAQADQSYFFGENAVRMAGARDVEPGVDPVPDLAVEVEVGNPVDRALGAWARLGVPEVWHLDATRDDLRLRVLRLDVEASSYAPATRSGFLPVSDEQVLGLLRSSVSEGSQPWQARLPERVAQILATGR